MADQRSAFVADPGSARLAALAALRGRPLVFYGGGISRDSVPALYRWLQRQGKCEQLDLVLSTTGGEVVAARKLALLLREFTEHLTVLVPYRAWSAGTLLCLGADEIIMGPVAELSPVDAQMGASGDLPGAPSMIAAADLRLFPAMAEAWFGTGHGDGLQLLAVVAQHVFPSSLTAFYRFERLVKEVATELLRYQLPAADLAVRETIAERLSQGFHSHDYALLRADAEGLGLRVAAATPEEAALLWDVHEFYTAQLTPSVSDADQGTLLIIAAADFRAKYAFQWAADATGSAAEDHLGATRVMRTRWDIEG